MPTSAPLPADDSLEKVWASWWKLLQGYEPLKEKGEPICLRLSRFTGGHHADQLEKTAGQMAMGVSLILAASRWSDAAIGPHDYANSSSTDRARGEQWRLVMAWAGLEKLIKTLLIFDGRLEIVVFSQFANRCSLNDCIELAPPSQKFRKMKQSRLVMPHKPGRYTGRLRGWLDGQAIQTWADLITITYQLRNATTHGSMTAYRANQWHLRPTFCRLTNDIATVAASAVTRLLEDR